MEFEEFEKEFEEKKLIQQEAGYFTIDVIENPCKMCAGYLLEISLDEDNFTIIGRYDTLKEAYEALKEICKLNNVEMEC